MPAPRPFCPRCGDFDVVEAEESDTFDYGNPCIVKVTAKVITLTCEPCEWSWTDHRSEGIRTDAILAALVTRIRELEALLE